MAENDGRVVSNFMLQALRNDDITVFGEGRQTRSFCYVSDLIDGMIKMMENEQEFIGPVNLGNPVENSILEFAEKIITITGSKSKIINKPLPQDDPKQRRPDITLAQEKLGWQPVVDLETGLKTTADYFKSKLLSGSIE
jgi:UDP-glucuronate decarboxylase